MIKNILLPIVIAIFLFHSTFASAKKFLVHAKTSLKIDDAQICAVPNVAWAALQKGHEVTILFDASGVTAIKKGGIFRGHKTPIDDADLPERERKLLSSQLNMPLRKIPHNYGEYIHFLKEKGVKLYVNKTMMLLHKIKIDEIDPSVTPINLNKMVELIDSTEIYVSY